MTNQPGPSAEWESFHRVVEARRSVRDFDGEPLSPADESAFREVLAAALLAPSSANLQPFELHWIRDPSLKARVAEACNAQRAARTASTLVIVTSSLAVARRSLDRLATQASDLEPAARDYHRGIHQTLRRFLRFAPLSVVGILHVLAAQLLPVLSLFPLGRIGIRNWLSRNSIFAAQTLLLGATARGFDTCPMEGFDARKLARLLALPRGTVIPMVIAVGHRLPDARIEPRLRRPFDDAVVVH